jgi:hypothetical protein
MCTLFNSAKKEINQVRRGQQTSSHIAGHGRRSLIKPGHQKGNISVSCGI